MFMVLIKHDLVIWGHVINSHEYGGGGFKVNEMCCH